jgi:hypothetical protein
VPQAVKIIRRLRELGESSKANAAEGLRDLQDYYADSPEPIATGGDPDPMSRAEDETPDDKGREDRTLMAAKIRGLEDSLECVSEGLADTQRAVASFRETFTRWAVVLVVLMVVVRWLWR